MTERSSGKVIRMQRLGGEGKISNTGLSVLETDIAKSFPVSQEVVFDGFVGIW